MNCDECGKEFAPMSATKPVEIYLRGKKEYIRLHEHCWLAIVTSKCIARIVRKGA